MVDYQISLLDGHSAVCWAGSDALVWETIRMFGVLALARATGVNWPDDASAEANQTGC